MQQSRIGNVHAPETTGKFAAATFEHDTARPVAGYAAPQLHTHAVIFNVTERENGQTRSVQSHELYASQHYGTAIYRAELATRLQKLGYEIERGKDGRRRSRATRGSTWRRRAHGGSRCRTTSGSRASTARPQGRSPPIAPVTRRSCCRRRRCSASTGSLPGSSAIRPTGSWPKHWSVLRRSSRNRPALRHRWYTRP